MHLQVITPEKEFFAGEITGVQMPGVDGSFEILNDHAPIIAALTEGDVRINSTSGVTKLSISSGFVECLNNQVTLLAESATEA